MSSGHESGLGRLQQKIWNGSIALEIRLASSECRTFDQSDPYMIQAPRLSYLPFLLPRLHAFFRAYLIDPESAVPHHGWFSYETVPLKWHYPVGLLYDLYSGAEPATADDQSLASTLRGLKSGTAGRAKGNPESSGGTDQDDEEGGVELRGLGAPEGTREDEQHERLPWKLTVHFADYPAEDLVKLDGDGKVLLDAFRNSVKEASFIRHGTGKVVMSLSYEDSTQMWRAVEQHNLDMYLPVQNKLLNPPGLSLKNLPVRLYLPNASPSTGPAAAKSPSPAPDAPEDDTSAAPGTLRIVQSLVSPYAPGGGRRQQPQTLGMALNAILPALFPSRRSPLLALPVLHGAVVPLAADVEELARAAAYADGWLHLSVRMMT